MRENQPGPPIVTHSRIDVMARVDNILVMWRDIKHGSRMNDKWRDFKHELKTMNHEVYPPLYTAFYKGLESAIRPSRA